MRNRSRTKARGSSAPREQPENSLQRMLEESKQRQAEVAALLEGSRAVLRYREFQEAARSIFDSCKKLVGATSGYVALLSKKGTENEVLFLDSGGLCCTVDPSLPMPIRGLRGEAYRSGKAVYCNDFARSEWVRFLPKGHVRLQNVLFAPLTVEDQVVGLLGIANKPGGFDDHDARIASAFGELAAIALLNSRTLESLENSEERFRSVTQSANDGVISADCSGKIVFWNEAAAKMFGYSADEIIGEPLTLLMPGQFHEAHQKGMDRVVSTGRSAIIGETIEVVGLRKDGSQFPIELSLGTWTTKEGTFFTGILRDVTERKQGEQTLQLSHRFLQITNRHSAMNPLLAEFAAEVKNFTGCAAVGIRVLDEQGNIPYQVNTGFSRDFCELESPLSIKTDHGMCINVIKGAADAKLPFYTQRGSFYINGTTQYLATVSPQQKGQTRDVCHEFGYESVALVPIRLGSRILGLIHVADPRENMVPLETVQVLEGAALQLGAAIQRVRAEEALHKAHDELETKVRQRTAELAQANQALQAEIAERQRLEKEILRVSAQEQHRIGQELHDGLGQQLLGLGMMAKSLQRTLQARSLPEANSACEITDALIDAQNHVRAILKGVYPVNVDANGLMAALADLAGSTQALSEIPCTFVCDQPVPVEDNHTATQLFHIASEAVRNAVKHADAKHIAIGLGCDETKLTLWVRDDGVGIRKDPNQIAGMGLRIMRHRARVVGASLEIRAATGGGTLVACSLQREDGK